MEKHFILFSIFFRMNNFSDFRLSAFQSPFVAFWAIGKPELMTSFFYETRLGVLRFKNT